MRGWSAPRPLDDFEPAREERVDEADALGPGLVRFADEAAPEEIPRPRLHGGGGKAVRVGDGPPVELCPAGLAHGLERLPLVSREISPEMRVEGVLVSDQPLERRLDEVEPDGVAARRAGLLPRVVGELLDVERDVVGALENPLDRLGGRREPGPLECADQEAAKRLPRDGAQEEPLAEPVERPVRPGPPVISCRSVVCEPAKT